MMLNKMIMKIFTGIMALIMCGIIFLSAPVNAEDIKWPDFSKITGKIDGYSLPLVEGPFINGGRNEDGYLNFSCTYRNNSDVNFQEIVLFFSYIPDPYYVFKGGMPERIEYESLYGPGYGREAGLKWLEEMRAEDYFHEIQVENTAADRFSLLYRYTDANFNIPWNGLRVLTYHENYIIRVDAEGKGWNSDTQFLKDFDMAEQYAKDAIDSLEGGLSLKHYAPLDYLKAGGGYDHRPAGDLIAKLTDKDGKSVKNKAVVFYIEPGSTLEKVMANGQTVAWLNNQILGTNPVVLGESITDKEGEASLNYLWPNLIKTDDFSRIMLEQRYLYDEKGKIEGTVNAVTINKDTQKIEQKASVHIEFTSIAKIVKITGNGRTQEFKNAYLKEFPDSPTWGPGKVRVKRSIVLPHFNYTPVEEGFLLMPGDIIDIDGGVEVEIVWITGDRAIARVPDKIQFGDTEVRPPHSRIILSTSSYDSGFENTWDKLKGGIFGFSIGQGLDILGGLHPVAEGVKKTGEFCVDIYDALKEVDFTEQHLITRIRIRSVIRVNTLGEKIQIQNIEGSPEIKTSGGGTVTLAKDEAVAVTFSGVLSQKTSIKDAGGFIDWSSTIDEWQKASDGLLSNSGQAQDTVDKKSGSGSTGIIIGVVAGIVVIGVGMVLILSHRRRKA
jgi:hypothetical protein